MPLTRITYFLANLVSAREEEAAGKTRDADGRKPPAAKTPAAAKQEGRRRGGRRKR